MGKLLFVCYIWHMMTKGGRWYRQEVVRANFVMHLQDVSILLPGVLSFYRQCVHYLLDGHYCC